MPDIIVSDAALNVPDADLLQSVSAVLSRHLKAANQEDAQKFLDAIKNYPNAIYLNLCDEISMQIELLYMYRKLKEGFKLFEEMGEI